jgi:hypothetical protein
MSSFLIFFLLFTTTIDLRLMGTSPDEDLISYVHVAHGLEVSSQTNSSRTVTKKVVDELVTRKGCGVVAMTLK